MAADESAQMAADHLNISCLFGGNRRAIGGHLRFQRFLVALLTAASTFAFAQEQRPSQPEPPSGWTPKQLAHAKKYMVAAAHPLAVEAGLRMLERGGNA